jgi:hypothetical protein
VAVFGPVLVCPITKILHSVLTFPVGPQYSILVTISPTSHKINKMKAPRITMPGRSERWEISQIMSPRKRIEREATVTQ